MATISICSQYKGEQKILRQHHYFLWGGGGTSRTAELGEGGQIRREKKKMEDTVRKSYV